MLYGRNTASHIVSVIMAPIVSSLVARCGFKKRSWIHLMMASRNWIQFGVLLIQPSSSKPRIEDSTLEGSGNLALGIQMDCLGERTGLYGSCDASF